jgi:uncharacterized membrane protein YphA (DoxX/SURF4 family)
MNPVLTNEISVSSEQAPVAIPARRYAPTAARIGLGLVFFVFGLNGFLNFIPQPSTPLPDGAVAFSTALMKTGYLFQLIKGTEVVVGALLLANRFVPLALALIAPVVVNIVAMHAFLMPQGLGMALVVLGLECYLAWTYRRVYRAMLTMRVVP